MSSDEAETKRRALRQTRTIGGLRFAYPPYARCDHLVDVIGPCINCAAADARQTLVPGAAKVFIHPGAGRDPGLQWIPAFAGIDRGYRLYRLSDMSQLVLRI